MRRALLALGVVAIAAAITTGAFGGAGATPGVSARIVTIGGTFPFTGPASSYAPIPVGMKAYFSYINARRGPDDEVPLLAGKTLIGGAPAVYICERFACQVPITDPALL